MSGVQEYACDGANIVQPECEGDAVTRRMQALITELWRLERNLVSEGYDRALARLERELPFDILEFRTGEDVLSWSVPPKWSCREAWIETLDGRRLIDRADHPLHVAVYSCPVNEVVSRDELLSRVHHHPTLPDAIPFAWKYYQHDWAFCCTRAQREALVHDRYRVRIDATFEPGTLKVAEFVLPGATDEEFVFCAHLCHPHMVNDDLTGVVAAIEVMRRLADVPERRLTYRLLIGPETIGSVAWLSRNLERTHRIAGGMFLEMLGTDCPHALQLSYAGGTEYDLISRAVLREHDPEFWFDAFRRVIGNDERQFNGPGFRIPMVSLSRVHHPSSGKWPYAEYHTSLDTPERVSWTRLRHSVDIVLAIVEAIESARYPVPRYRGELFCTRYGLFEDFYENPEGHRVLMDVIHAVDGTLSADGIAEKFQLPKPAVREVLAKLEDRGLVSYADRPGRA